MFWPPFVSCVEFHAHLHITCNGAFYCRRMTDRLARAFFRGPSQGLVQIGGGHNTTTGASSASEQLCMESRNGYVHLDPMATAMGAFPFEVP